MRRDLTVLWAVMRKDLRLELRSRERIVVMGAFVVLLAVLAHYSIDDSAVLPSDIEIMLPVGFLWLAVLLAGLVGVGRTFQIEAADGAFEGVLASPASLGAVYLGKVGANLLLVWATAGMALTTFWLLFDLPIEGGVMPLVFVFALGSTAFTALATLFAAVSNQSRLGESLLPVLLFPLLVPVLIHGVAATNRILLGGGVSDIMANLKMLGAEALLTLALGTTMFRFTVED